MRTKYSIKNSITAAISYVIAMLVGFISQTIFIRLLGTEYLGLNGVLTNIMAIVTFIELGIGDAIVYKLYKPIANNDLEEVKRIMIYYKKIYIKIIILIIFLGLIGLPFLSIVINSLHVNVNIYLIYLLFLTSSILNYILNYNKSLIFANQRSYINNIIHIFYLIILNILQLFILIKTKNYYLYIVIKIIVQILEVIITRLYSHKLFPLDKIQNKEENIKKLKNIKPLFFHKINLVVAYYSDNIIISYFLGVNIVGLYSNYFLIVNSVNTLMSEIIRSVNASVGNYLVLEKSSNNYEIFKKIQFLNFYLLLFSNICIYNIIEDFIVIWLGFDFLLSKQLLLFLIISQLFKFFRHSYSIFYEVSGIWQKDLKTPIIGTIINLLFSIILTKKFGLIGIFLGGIISTFIFWLYTYPIKVYKEIFNKNYKIYLKDLFNYIVLFIIFFSINHVINSLFEFENIYINLIFNFILSILIINILFFLLFRNDYRLIYFKNLIKKYIRKI